MSLSGLACWRTSPSPMGTSGSTAMMRFENTCIESLAVAPPGEVLTSAQIEERLRPLYERLKLPEGRLELMTGIRERRLWPEGTRPSDASAAAGKAVLAKSALSATAGGVVYPFRRKSRHAGAGNGVVRPPENRAARDRADLRRLQRVPRIS